MAIQTIGEGITILGGLTELCLNYERYQTGLKLTVLQLGKCDAI